MTVNQKRYIRIGVVVVAVLVALGIYRSRIGTATAVTVTEASLRNVTETVVANGKIRPETEVVISSEVSGKILELPFKEGASVKAGELLVKINPDLAQAALDRAVASYNNALANKANAEARFIQTKAQLRNAEITYKRTKALWENEAVSQAEYDNALASFESAQAEADAAEQNIHASGYSVQSAEATVKESRDSYSRTSIFSPMDGTVSRLTAEVGEQVVGAMQMTGTEIMRVANLDVMEVLVEVNESDIVRVSRGDTALIEVDAYPNRKFKGVVTETANSAKSSGAAADQVTNFDVKVRISEDSYSDLVTDRSRGVFPFRPGMNATVDIITATAVDVLAVPLESVTTRSDTSQNTNRSVTDKLLGDSEDAPGKERITVVFLERDGRALLRAVKTGIQDDRYIQIIEGLDAGDRVISGPYDAVSRVLTSGDEVEVVSKADLYGKK